MLRGWAAAREPRHPPDVVTLHGSRAAGGRASRWGAAAVGIALNAVKKDEHNFSF